MASYHGFPCTFWYWWGTTSRDYPANGMTAQEKTSVIWPEGQATVQKLCWNLCRTQKLAVFSAPRCTALRIGKNMFVCTNRMTSDVVSWVGWWLQYLEVSWNGSTSKSSISISRLFHYKSPILGYPYFRKPAYKYKLIFGILEFPEVRVILWYITYLYFPGIQKNT